ncbi:MAG: alkaline phosphatase [Planctomyces sp.]|nr:alkaline phosphatase [Planctomyces sp.]
MGRAELSSGGVPLTWSRRQVLVAGLGAVLWPTLAKWSHGSVLNRNHRLGPNPFGLGVASGDPTPEGAVLWTRIAPNPLSGEELEPVAMPVKWEVADDEKFTRIVQSGTAVATPDLAHSVHVELKGLPPDRWYFYRFITSGETSRVGRFRTTPLATAMPRELNFAFASCQHFEQGLFTAYDHLAKEDLDLVFHLGDYIYEYKGKDKLVRKHLGEEIETLANYRQRHAQYKSDEFLQAAHALCPWVVAWDDHEFDNNCANYISEQKNVDAASFLDRRANSYRAYYEHMPLPATCLPEGPHMALYRPSNFGRLADFSVLDTRQYRSDQPCGDGNKPPCPESLLPSQTMLGPKQEQWLADRLQGSQSVWNVLAQQVMMGHVDRKAGEEIAYSMDQWPGYEVERQRVIGFFEREKISNPVVLTGDIHSNWVNNLASGKDDNAAPVATEFVVTSISSGGNGSQNLKYAQTVQDENPFVKFYNAERGYVSCKVTPQSWTSKYQVVEYVDTPGAPLVTRATFEVEAGKAGAERV